MKVLRCAGLPEGDSKFAIHSTTKPTEAKGVPTIGARGCFTAHREAMREAVDAGASSVLIIEDDIAVRSNMDEAASMIRNAMSADWQIIYFGYLEPKDPRLFPGIHPTKESTLGGHFYGIREPYLSLMVAFMDECEARPAGHPAGGPMFRDGAFNHYRSLYSLQAHLATPCLGGQRSSRTDLHALGLKDRIPIIRNIVEVARRYGMKRLS